MFSIKESTANCLECPLYDAPSVIMETNCSSFDDVEIVFVIENPDKAEIEEEAPLVGPAGKIFRKYFNQFELDKRNYILTNIVMCQSISKDGTTGNPTQDVITKCKANCFDIIRNANPKLIVLMGSTPVREFGLLESSGITSIRGQMFKWEGMDVLVTTDPSYVQMRRGTEDETNFANDIKKAGELIGSKYGISQISDNQILDKSCAHYYRIPDKFYTEDYYLLDVQYIKKTTEILYIFLDKDGNKVYHRENDEYIFYTISDENNARCTVPYSELHQVKSQNRKPHGMTPKLTYEGDIKLETKHAIDYYLTRTAPLPEVIFKTLFFDIECSSKDGLSNSSVEEASDIVTIIGFYYDGKHTTYVLDPKFLDKSSTHQISVDNCIICKNERELLRSFIREFVKIDPMFVSEWFGSGYDFPYIFKRCEKNGIDVSEMSRFREVSFNPFNNRVHIAGVIELDMLVLYKEYTFVKEESYSLDFIANKYLGEGKLGKGYNFSRMFREDPNEAILYNRRDVDILPRLDSKLRHINFCNDIRLICKTNFDATRNTIGMLDSMLLSYLKPMGMSVKSSDTKEKTEKYTGAYVKEPKTGLHELICDFDFSSLYPSIIITYNIGINTFLMKLVDEKLGYELMYSREDLPDKIDIIIDPLFKAELKTITKENLLKLVDEEKLIYTINGCFYKQHEKEKSYYSDILDSLMKTRKLYKSEMFNAKLAEDFEKEKILDSKQTALKVLANSLYGGIGNNSFRFYNVDCAKSITLGGQEVTKNSIIHVDSYIDSLKSGSYIASEKMQKSEMFSDEHIVRDIKHVITGDTDSLFVTYENIIKNEINFENIKPTILEYNSKVQNFLNNDIILNLSKKRNVDPQHNRLELKNELIITRGHFLAKKRYAIRVVFHEGKATDEIVQRGIETRRSDYPSYTKEKLRELLDLLLKSEKISLKNILTFSKLTEEEILSKIIAGEQTIARPVSYGKKLEEYKSIPEGARGMENFNILEYKTFYVGSRGYLFQIKGLDFDEAPANVVTSYVNNFRKTGKKLDVIVIPEQIITLPKYYIIDTMDMLRFSWIDRYKLMLEPLLAIDKKMLAF